MTLEGYGIRLEPLTVQSAEIVRCWRNTPQILAQMEYREIITEAMQQEWFMRIQDQPCMYFLISAGDQPAGMIHLADIDPLECRAEAGLFIGDPAFTGTGLALGASLLLLDHAFSTLKLEAIFAKVRNTNTAAQQYNRLLGFQKIKQLNDDFDLYDLSKAKYLLKREALEKLVK